MLSAPEVAAAAAGGGGSGVKVPIWEKGNKSCSNPDRQ